MGRDNQNKGYLNIKSDAIYELGNLDEITGYLIDINMLEPSLLLNSTGIQ